MTSRPWISVGLWAGAAVCICALCGLASAAPFIYSETFEGTVVGQLPNNWTATTAGTGTIAVSNLRSFGPGTQSMYMNSIPFGDRADVVGPPPAFGTLDFTAPYSVDFDLNYDKRQDPAGFHFVEVFAMNAPPGNNHQVGLFLDRPNWPGIGGWDELIYRCPAGNFVIAGTAQNVWYTINLVVNPFVGTYNATIIDRTNALQIYDPTTMLTVNMLTLNNIPFIGVGQGQNFFPFRFGDRNADGFLYDHGEAYWDNIFVLGTSVPTPMALTAGLIALPALVLLRALRGRAKK